MKKSLLLVPVLAVMLSFSACGFDIHKQLSTNISETCNNYFVGETNDYYINLFSGSREKVYQLDGISTEKIPYAILSVRCKTARNNEELQFSVEINDKTYDGALKNNPYDSTLEADIETTLANSDVVYVYIKDGDDTQVANLKCVSENFFVNSQTALDIALDEIINQKIEFDKTLKYECFVQVLNKDASDNLYFWIVSVVSSDGAVWNVIIDTSTGKVLAKNCNNLQ